MRVRAHGGREYGNGSTAGGIAGPVRRSGFFERRRVVHFNVTSHPTAEWTSQQLLQAFPYDTAPQYVLRDRDRIYGEDVRRQLEDMGIKQVLTAPRSLWQTPYVERLIGSIRRECLGHIIAINEESLRETL